MNMGISFKVTPHRNVSRYIKEYHRILCPTFLRFSKNDSVLARVSEDCPFPTGKGQSRNTMVCWNPISYEQKSRAKERIYEQVGPLVYLCLCA